MFRSRTPKSNDSARKEIVHHVVVYETPKKGFGDFVVKLVLHFTAWLVLMVVGAMFHSPELGWILWLIFFGVTRYYKYRRPRV